MSGMLKRVFPFVLLASVVATFVVGCGNSTVAKVNGQKISRQAYYERLERLPYNMGQNQTTEAGVLVLQRLITEDLLLKLAEKEHVAATDQQIKDRIAQSMKQPGFAANLKRNGITKEQLKDLTRVEQAAYNLQTKGVTVSPAEVKKVYDDNLAARFTVPEQVQLAAIFVNSKADADKAMSVLKSGVEFGTVARTMSQHPSSKNDGKLMPLYRHQRDANGREIIPEAIQVVIFSTPKGKHTDPIASGNGSYAIFEVLQHFPQKVQKLSEVQSGIRDQLMLAKGMQKNQNVNLELEKFRQTAKIEVMIDRYRPLLVPPKPKPPAKEASPAKPGK